MIGSPPEPARESPPAAPAGRTARWMPLLPAALVLLLGAVTIVATGFNGLYGQDPYGYWDYATGPLLEALRGRDAFPSFFWPPGYPLLVALGSLAFGATPAVAQAISLGMATAAAAFTALLARELAPGRSGWPTPLVAGLLMAAVGQLLQSGVVVMADTTGLAAATLGAWALARYGAGRSGGGGLALASGAMAFAILTRWAYALVAVPALAYALAALARRPLAAATRHAAAAALAALIVLWPVLPGVAGVLGGGGPDAFVGNFDVYSWNPARAFQQEFATADGRLSYRWPNGLYYLLLPVHGVYFTPLLAPLILAGAARVLGGGRAEAAARAAPHPALLLVGWPLLVYGFHAGAPWQNVRFVLALTPPLAVLGAMGGEGLWRRGGAARAAAWTLVAAALALMVWGGIHHASSLIALKSDALATARWVEDRLPGDARLLAFELTATLQHESGIETHELFVATDDSLAGWIASTRPLYLLVDVADLESQWAERTPGIHYRRLLADPGLEERGRRGTFTLFRVGAR